MCIDNGYLLCAVNDTENDLVKSDVRRAIDITLMLIIFLMVLVSNTMIATVLVFAKQIPQSTVYLMASLCFTDFELAIVMLLQIISGFYNRWVFGSTLCNMIPSFTVSLISGTCQLFLVMTIDKYIKILYPLRYNSIVTKRRLQIVVALNWLLITGMVVISSQLTDFLIQYVPQYYTCLAVYEGVGDLQDIMSTKPYIPSCITVIQVICNTHILWIAHKHHRREIGVARKVGDKKKTHADFKGVTTILVGSGCFFICFFPSIVIMVLIFAAPHLISNYFVFISHMMMYCNSFCNWFVYTRTHVSFKSDQQDVWKKIKMQLFYKDDI